jgi:L-ribulokinase
MTQPLVIGIDFGTLSGRAVIVRVSDGAELGSAVHAYPHGVLERHLPGSPDQPLPLHGAADHR